MNVQQLINALRTLPTDAEVFIDDDDYPRVEGAFVPDDDPDDRAKNVVLLEISFPPTE